MTFNKTSKCHFCNVNSLFTEGIEYISDLTLKLNSIALEFMLSCSLVTHRDNIFLLYYFFLIFSSVIQVKSSY